MQTVLHPVFRTESTPRSVQTIIWKTLKYANYLPLELVKIMIHWGSFMHELNNFYAHMNDDPPVDHPYIKFQICKIANQGRMHAQWTSG